MYTQCPECDVAFHVSAKALKQAAGKVRCGGCGVAFNALSYLFEEIPAAPTPEADTPPTSISVERSAGLLDALDQLAGDDVRIEDTGTEWLVLDPNQPGNEDDGYVTPTDAPEQMRFDDNTPLPDDFDLDAPTSPAEEPVVETVEPARSLEDSQVDLVFGDPDEWQDLLGDLEDAAATLLDNEVVDDEQPPDMDTQFAMQAEAMGIDLSGTHNEVSMAEVGGEEEEPETSIDEDLIAAAFEAEAATNLIAGREPEESLEEDPDEAFVRFSEPDIVDVPEPTEEEKTVNFMIDRDLLAIAVEDDDGFTSTIVQKQDSSADDISGGIVSTNVDKEVTADVPLELADDSVQPNVVAASKPLFETIIMEGDLVHSTADMARRASDRSAASVSLKRFGLNTERRDRRDWEPPKYSMIGAAVLLFLVLLLQVIHHSREALATSATFQKTVGPVYRLVGSPVTPAWDIKGWRFEATKGNTGLDDQVLTIYSRIGNRSDQSLPFPLVHVSLTDRFEEIIGSRVLEPAEYLVGSADPRGAVSPGNTFNAVIAIESPSGDATGFKLNVCYRLTSGQLRCAIEAFK